ncbi:MAG: DNA repair protein RadA [Andreesenia angusta]|nr:DNA repair protein RadA [Andreesenia angusta]
MRKKKTLFVCQECGYESPKWMGKCPGCNQWNTITEEIVDSRSNKRKNGISSKTKKPEKIVDLKSENEKRIKSNILELDRVLGGGIVRGSLVLFGGDPGIGKSTLLIQASGEISKNGQKVLYITGEESSAQLKLRADRLNISSEELYILAETDLDIIFSSIDLMKPDIVIIDSIQTIFSPDIESAPGSVSQVREVTSVLMRKAKSEDIAILIVGHVTKEGAIAGPRVLEHMVDTVLYFEGERHNTYRVLRGVKNRFGSTNEIGIFEMKQDGLIEVKNPSEMLISSRPDDTEGSIVVPSLEGTRPMLIEIQALVSSTPFGMPRRVATGLDYNRVILMTAVLDKKAGIHLESSDIYVNIVGGINIKEPALDLGIVAAIISSFRERPIDSKIAVVGEIGLTGEIRSVSSIDKRIIEVQKMGFKKIIVPKANLKGLKLKDFDIKIIGVSTIIEAVREMM